MSRAGFLPLPACRALGLPHHKASFPGGPRSGSWIPLCTEDDSSPWVSVSPSVKMCNWSPKSHPAEILEARNSSSWPGPNVEEQPGPSAGPCWGIWRCFLSSTQGLFPISPQLLPPQGCGSAPTGRQRGFPWWLKALEKASRAIEHAREPCQAME